MTGRSLALLLCAGTSLSSSAQVVRLHPAKAAPQLTSGTLSISVTPSAVNFALVPGGQARGSSPLSIISSINFTVVSSVSLFGYFSSTNALTTQAGDVLPSSVIFGQDLAGSPTSFTAFTQTTPFGGNNGLMIYRVGNLVSFNQNRTDTLSLMIDLTSIPQVAAGSYQGTLVLEAQAF